MSSKFSGRIFNRSCRLHCIQDHGRKTRQPECQFYLSPSRNQPVLQRNKYRSGVFHPSAESHTTWRSYPGSRGTHCPKVLSRAQAYSNWSRWASLLDVERFLPPPSSGDYEAVQSFIARKICAPSLETCQCDSHPKGITLNELQSTTTHFSDKYHN